jgi:hypothetical protein
LLDIACFEPLFDQLLSRSRANGFEQIRVRDVVERAINLIPLSRTRRKRKGETSR